MRGDPSDGSVAAGVIHFGGLLAICAVCFAGLEGSKESRGEIGETTVQIWADGRTAAISLTHDDNRWDHSDIAAPALTARYLTGTFNVNPGLPSWVEMQSCYAAMAQAGHELASHTMYHQACLIVPPEDDPGGIYFHSLEELEQDCIAVKAILDPMQPERCTQTFCYPWGLQCDETRAVIAAYFLSARSVGAGFNSNPASPPDMYRLRPSYVGAAWAPGWDDYAYAYLRLTWYLNGALASGGWVLEEYHDIQWPGYSALNLQAYYDHLDDLADAVSAGELWVAPQGDVARYIYSRDAATVTLLGTHLTRIELITDDGLDDDLFNVPITLRTRIPLSWASVVRVEHGGEPVEARVEIHGSGAFVVYSIVADGGLIRIRARPTPDCDRALSPRIPPP
jgi:peptidoglycan/xylan/chitin deacetylase (PgdA/CDA1 family)